MKYSAPSIVASTIHGEPSRRRRSFVSTVQSLAADVRGHVQGRTPKEELLPPPKIGQQIPTKAASILGRSIYSGSRSVDNISTMSMGARPRPSSSASAGSLGLAPTSRPLMTLRLSSTSFLETTIADDLQCQQLYVIQTRGALTTISREDAVQGLTRIGTICWKTEREEERMSFGAKSDVTVLMANGRRRSLDDFLRSNKLLGSRKFNIPHYPYTLKWKRYGRIYNLTLSKFKKVVATLEPAVLSAPPRLRVFEPVYERDETRPQLEHQGVPIPLLDYLITTSLLLLTDKDEWQHINGGAKISHNASGANLPSFRSDSGSSNCDAGAVAGQIHRWRSGVETEPFSSRPSSPALSSVEDGITSSATDESVSVSQTRKRVSTGHRRTVSNADETASIPSFRSFRTDTSVSSTIRPSPTRPPPQQHLPEAVRLSEDSETSVVSILHPFSFSNLNDERDDVTATFDKTAVLGGSLVVEEIHASRSIHRVRDDENRRMGESDSRTIRATTLPPSNAPSLPQVQQSPPRSASLGDTSSGNTRRATRPRPLPRPLPRPPLPPTSDIPPVPKLSPDALRLYSQNYSHDGPSSSRRMVSSPLSSSYTATTQYDSLTGTSADAGPSSTTRDMRRARSQTLRRIASDTTISPVHTSLTYAFELSDRSRAESGPSDSYKRPPHSDDFNPYEDSAFSYASSSHHQHQNSNHYRSHFQGPLPLRIQNIPDAGSMVDPLSTSSLDSESEYHSLHSPPLYPASPPESSYLCSQPPPAYDSIDFSHP